ncbi:MAG: DUF177 domain-containing protein [Clostridiales bacterium]|nr:DUF177 domain-containing protein [Clostridiales bacterium]
MKLDVSTAIRFPGEAYPFSGRQAIAPVDVLGDSVVFDDAQVQGTFEAMEDGSIVVEGSIECVCHAHCANCLADTEQTILTDFRETVVRNGDPDDDDVFSYTGYQVDLEKLVMSCAVLALPMRFLCREDCTGIVLEGQTDSHVCLCQEADGVKTQRPFAALQQLLAEKSDEK